MKLTGTVTAADIQEPLPDGKPWSCQRWTINVSLMNSTRWPLELGTDFFLFEASADSSVFEGAALFRGTKGKVPEPPLHLLPFLLPAEPYGVSNNFLICFANGALFPPPWQPGRNPIGNEGRSAALPSRR